MDLRSASSHSRRKEATREATRRDPKDSADAPASRNTPLPSRSFHFPTRRLPLTSRSFHLPRVRHSSTKSESAETPEKCGYQSLDDDIPTEKPSSRQQSLRHLQVQEASTDDVLVGPDHSNEYAQLSFLDHGGSHHEAMNVNLVRQPSVKEPFVQDQDAAEMYGYEDVSDCRVERNRRESRHDRPSRRGSCPLGHSSAASLSALSMPSTTYGYEDVSDCRVERSRRESRQDRPSRRGSCPLGHSSVASVSTKSMHSTDVESPDMYGYEDCGMDDHNNNNHNDSGTVCHLRPGAHRPTRRASIGACTSYAPSSRSTSPRPVRRQRRRSMDNRHQHQHPTGLSGRTRTTSSTLAKRRASLGSVSPDPSVAGTEATEASSRPSIHLDGPEKESPSILDGDIDTDDDESFGGLDHHFHRSLNDSMVHVLEGLEALDARLLYGYS